MKQKLGMLPAPAAAEPRALGAGEQAPAEAAPAAAPPASAAENGSPATQQPAPAAAGPRIHEAELLEEFEALEEEERGRA
jgi:hypothetical protein